MTLTNRKRVFVREYLSCWNATEAALRAGYSERTARSQGSRLLTDVDIAPEIQLALHEKAMTADEVIQRIAEQARSEQSNYFNESGQIDIKRLIADGKGHLIKSIKQTQWGRHIEFYDAQAALVLLGKHLGLFTENLTVDQVLKVIVEYADAIDPTEAAR